MRTGLNPVPSTDLSRIQEIGQLGLERWTADKLSIGWLLGSWLPVFYGSPKRISPMRKIESQMIAAIRAKKDWRNNNTEVRIIENGIQFHPSFNRTIDVYLHHNKIASIDHMAGRMTLNSRGWRTATTKSRMNAILREFCGSGIYQKDHVWYIDDKEFEDNTTVSI